MTRFCPPGFWYSDDLRNAIGHDELKSKLMVGDWIAYFWASNSREPLQRIAPSEWWKAHTDQILAKGKALPSDFQSERGVSSIGGDPILIVAPGYAPATNGTKTQATISPAKLQQFLLDCADGTRKESVIKSLAIDALGKIPEQVWRKAWGEVPLTKKLPRGRPQKIR